jgi:quinol monooxygenase YgiN
MVVIRFKAKCQPDKVEQALEAFAAVVPPSRQLEGVIGFDVCRDILDENAIIAVEVFEDDAARQRQESLPEVARVMGLLPSVLAGPPEATVFAVTSSADALASA